VPRYVLDTNLYVRAARSDEWNGALEAFYASFAPFVYLHSVVATELLAGCTNDLLERRTQTRLIEPFEARGRVVTPSHGAWKRSGRLIATLIGQKRISPNGIQRSFLNDCLLATSAREHGYTLITDNLADFELIRTVTPVDVVPPWPERPEA
jgi:predicted nucleic acid-binding protein